VKEGYHKHLLSTPKASGQAITFHQSTRPVARGDLHTDGEVRYGEGQKGFYSSMLMVPKKDGDQRSATNI